MQSSIQFVQSGTYGWVKINKNCKMEYFELSFSRESILRDSTGQYQLKRTIKTVVAVMFTNVNISRNIE